MSLAGTLLFYLCATIGVGSAVATVTLRSPLRAAVALLLHIVALAGLYLTLSAHFLAALQLLVYAGAVVVLFVFTIMLIGPDAEVPPNARTFGVRALGVAVVALLTAAAVSTVVRISPQTPTLAGCTAEQGAECGQFGGVGALGRVLYTDSVILFELVSVLLLVAVIGAVAVARGRTTKEAEAAKARRLAREAAEAEEEAAARKLSAEVAAHGGH
ncbi:MAG: NADH-quinone oxidoreductase subunit J [Polyangiales bacterium]|nr:NADH-quinone oxidoreductase subunit J [Myxococcales bacterium]